MCFFVVCRQVSRSVSWFEAKKKREPGKLQDIARYSWHLMAFDAWLANPQSFALNEVTYIRLGGGHWSPLAGWSNGHVLILDTNQQRLPPHWAGISAYLQSICIR